MTEWVMDARSSRVHPASSGPTSSLCTHRRYRCTEFPGKGRLRLHLSVMPEAAGQIVNAPG